MGKWRKFTVTRFSPIIRSFLPCFCYNIAEETIYNYSAQQMIDSEADDVKLGDDVFLSRNSNFFRHFFIKTLLFPFESVILGYVLGLDMLSHSTLGHSSIIEVFFEKFSKGTFYSGFHYVVLELATDILIGEGILFLSRRIYRFFKELEE